MLRKKPGFGLLQLQISQSPFLNQHIAKPGILLPLQASGLVKLFPGQLLPRHKSGGQGGFWDGTRRGKAVKAVPQGKGEIASGNKIKHNGTPRGLLHGGGRAQRGQKLL